MMECIFIPTESTVRDGKQEYVCTQCGHKQWSKYGPEMIHRNCGAVVDPTFPCVHRGHELRREECSSCSGSVQIKVFACLEFFAECQIDNKLPGGIRVCRLCSARRPD